TSVITDEIDAVTITRRCHNDAANVRAGENRPIVHPNATKLPWCLQFLHRTLDNDAYSDHSSSELRLADLNDYFSGWFANKREAFKPRGSDGNVVNACHVVSPHQESN